MHDAGCGLLCRLSSSKQLSCVVLQSMEAAATDVAADLEACGLDVLQMSYCCHLLHR